MHGRVLVTGGGGFIGSHLVDVLIAAGERITVLDDFSTGSPDNLCQAQTKGDVRVVRGSVLDGHAVETAMADADRVFHLAVQCVRRSLGNPRESHDVNATGTLNVLEAARRSSIRRFVYCSSSGVYGNASSGLLQEETTPCWPATVYGAAFREKPQVGDGRVNGGFFVFERSVFDQADESPTLSLEHDILPDLARRDELGAYHHNGFWQCMDTYRDLSQLNELCKIERAPWMIGNGW
jgi:hypothetical protein